MELNMSATPEPTPPPSTQLNIMVVDDYAVSRRLLEMLLSDLGHRIVVARSGQEAVEKARHERFDYIFLDLQMPDMDGHQTALAIRALGRGNAPVLVACSADDNRSLRETCQREGFSHILPKPASMESLEDVLSGNEEESEKHDEEQNPGHWELPESLQGLAELAGKKKVGDLLTLFSTESKRRVDVLIKTLQAHDTETFIRTAHSMKGSSAQMGAQKMAEISASLESQGKAGTRIDLRAIVALASELELVQQAISQYLQTP
jgi:CheY-like chemotaxis protein